MNAAELLTPSQLLKMQADGQPLASHAKECGACGKWLDSHQLLGNALGALRVSTEQREAPPKVEQAVLAAFRTQSLAPRVVEMPERSPRALWRMSRFFEVGAYAAVAAAIIVGLFLGARLLQDKRATKTDTQAQTVSVPQVNAVEAKQTAANETAAKGAPDVVATKSVRASEAPAKKAMRKQSESESSASDSAGYTAMMLCDPLICSGDTQVIRMELPASATEGSAGQPVLADVVIGEDGLIRAMRIVNQ
jgi:hypothetical protein